MRKNKFTSVELLVVLAILGLLMSLLLPSLKKPRGMAKQAVCLSNQKQIAVALSLYYSENDQLFPYGIRTPAEDLIDGIAEWHSRSPQECLYDFLGTVDVFVCPEDPSPENYSWWQFKTILHLPQKIASQVICGMNGVFGTQSSMVVSHFAFHT
ncbi:MAG: hypothetical protein NE334_21175 [Lentisphaeraceae bacterium]|nr:hypothetical protein [Lentisphaeraceae bacterium]